MEVSIRNGHAVIEGIPIRVVENPLRIEHCHTDAASDVDAPYTATIVIDRLDQIVVTVCLTEYRPKRYCYGDGDARHHAEQHDQRDAEDVAGHHNIIVADAIFTASPSQGGHAGRLRASAWAIRAYHHVMPVDSQTIMDVLATMPISIVDLGIVEDVRTDADTGVVHVDILPTFVGCPALDMIRDDIVREVGRVDDVKAVQVRFLNEPAWTVDRITNVGRASLKEHGVTVPAPGSGSGSGGACGEHEQSTQAAATLSISAGDAVPCPFCGSSSTRLESKFGPTRCRMIYYCDGCRNSFEHMKRV